MSAYYELESLPELESLYEAEWEGETPGAFESEMFFQELSQAARRGTSVAALQRLAMASAREALRQGGVPADGFDSMSFAQSEFEGESEAGYEGEMEQAVHFMQRFPTTALMEHLGHAAAEAETEGESFAFLAPLIPMAAKLAAPLLTKGLGVAAKIGGKLAAKALPQLTKAVTKNIGRAVPQMTKSLQGVAKTMLQNKQTRPLVRTLPKIAQRATVDLTRQAARGRPVTRATAAQAVARQAARVIGNPRQAVQAWQGSHALDRKFHSAAGTALPPPRAVAGAVATAPAQPAAVYNAAPAAGRDGGADATWGAAPAASSWSGGPAGWGGYSQRPARRRGCCCRCC